MFKDGSPSMTIEHERLLVRTHGGAWEPLTPQEPDGKTTFCEIFGSDIGPLVGSTAPILVVGEQTNLASGLVDALCVDADGCVYVVATALEASADAAVLLPKLLAHAGSMHGIAFDEFERLCNRLANGETLTSHISSRAKHADVHEQTLTVAVTDALASGRFHLVAIVADAPETLVQSMRFLNASGASISCLNAETFSSGDVNAVKVALVDVGLTSRTIQVSMTATGLLALVDRIHGSQTASRIGVMQRYCAENFDDVTYDGDMTSASMIASLHIDGVSAAIAGIETEGIVWIDFEEIGKFDDSWTARTELAGAISRMIGTDLGEIARIGRIRLTLGEHLNDDTLMEMFTDMLNDTIDDLRSQVSGRSRNGVAAPAA